MLRRKTAAYALFALYEIAIRQTPGDTPLGVRSGDIAERHHMPRAYVAKILGQLASAGILHSDRGPRGGFRLARPVTKITLFDVFEHVGALTPRENGEMLQFDSLPAPIRRAMRQAEGDAATALRRLFERTTLSDLLPAGSRASRHIG